MTGLQRLLARGAFFKGTMVFASLFDEGFFTTEFFLATEGAKERKGFFSTKFAEKEEIGGGVL